MITYTDPRIFAALTDGEYFLYHFIDINLTEPGFPPIYLTTYPSDITVWGHYYSASVVGGVERPPKSGSLTQEVQKITVNQALSDGFTDSALDIIRLLGNNYHNAPVSITTLMQIGDELILEAVVKSDGIFKNAQRSAKDGVVVMEFSNAFGKLDTVKELNTTPGSLARRDRGDTSFSRASIKVTKRTLDWGTKPGGEND